MKQKKMLVSPYKWQLNNLRPLAAWHIMDKLNALNANKTINYQGFSVSKRITPALNLTS